MRALLLALCALVAAWRAAGQVVTRCTERACFTLHDRAPFDAANTDCFTNGGYLLTMRDTREAEDARALLALADNAGLFPRGEKRLWLGLKLNKGSCVLDGELLRGFRWMSDPEDLGTLSKWGREPHSTCTEDRCVSLRSVAGSALLDWNDGSCKDRALYACRFQFKGMCEPLALAGPGEVNYTLPFSGIPISQGGALRMLPHGTLADISCVSSGERFDPMCRETGDGKGFSWTIDGPFCASGERSCARQNGGCSHLCVEKTAGDVGCACPEGYDLSTDKFTCYLKDPCRNAPCEHECVVMGARFECACPKGFELDQNGIHCVDEDECEWDVCGDHTCHNKPGSYECECKEGFRTEAGGACEDIDECAEGACSSGGAMCLNSQGSFSCSCSKGFRPSRSGGHCVDVDECISRPCEDICTNTDGSYECSCRANFRLADNGISCVQIIGPSPHTSASNGLLHEELDRSTTPTTSTPLFSSASSRPEAEDVVRRDSPAKHWMLVWVLGSVIPLLLLVTLTIVIAVFCWSRSRKDAKKKSATADSYCWVSTGFQSQPDTEAH
ncbi:hypothetical protein NFI96_004786 [Prochilodus magdalenae]|nr:hypothetical protein NFI96_004786 [Prochilodus magdalenae]